MLDEITPHHMKSLTHTILMVRPKHFGYNPQTADNNTFQQKITLENVAELAIAEFDQMVRTLKDHGIKVLVIDDADQPVLPDSIFPNNWFSTHESGIIYTYPMFAPNRRLERREDIIQYLEQHYQVVRRYSLEVLEEENKFLEGTGSMVFDRSNQVTYACLSPRTDLRALDTFAMISGYKPVFFTAVDRDGIPIYHTNVMMAMGHDFVVCCLGAVVEKDKLQLIESFRKTNKEIIEISMEQMEQFAGNMLELKNAENQSYLILSETAHHSLSPQQRQQIEEHTKLLPIPISTIEKIGGGSVRCMMAEVFLPEKRINY